MAEDCAPVRFVGIDWAQDKHDVCVMDASGQVMHEKEVKHSAGCLDEFCQWLSSLTDSPSASVYVAIEVPHGPVVETLLEKGFAVFSLNPKQLDRFRDRFSVAGAKDDRLDALVLADSLRTDMPRYRRLRVDTPEVIELREWSRMHGELKHEVNQLSNRMEAQLRRYYPQLLEVGRVTEMWLLDLWEKAPTPQKARRIRRPTLAELLKRRRIRRISAKSLEKALRQPSLTVAPGTTEAASAHIQLLVPRLRLALEHRERCEKQLQHLLDELHSDDSEEEECVPSDAVIMDSFPGLGTLTISALLAEASQAIRARDYFALRTLTGQAPVTRRSGKRLNVVSMRQACNERLRDALYHWSRVACQSDPYCKTQYAALRARGHGHARALRLETAS